LHSFPNILSVTARNGVGIIPEPENPVIASKNIFFNNGLVEKTKMNVKVSLTGNSANSLRAMTSNSNSYRNKTDEVW